MEQPKDVAITGDRRERTAPQAERERTVNYILRGFLSVTGRIDVVFLAELGLYGFGADLGRLAELL